MAHDRAERGGEHAARDGGEHSGDAGGAPSGSAGGRGGRAPASVHPTAVVDRSAELGPGVVVGPYCVIGENVRIGAGTELRNHVTIQGPCTIGVENVIYPYAVLGAEPQDLKYQGLDTELIIGDRNIIREHATIHRGTELGGFRTRIGDDVLIMVAVHVAHDCTLEDGVVIANNSMLGGHVLVERGATIAGGVGVHHFATIGELSFVGGMARVSKDVPPYCVVEGSPSEVRKVNTTALARAGWSAERIDAMKRAFRAVYRSPEVTVAEAIESLLGEPECTADVASFCRFVSRVEAGVHGRYLERERTDKRGR